MADLKTPKQMAEAYQTAIDAIVSGQLQSYSIPNRGSFTKFDLPALETAYRYWRRMAEQDEFGCVSLADANAANDAASEFFATS